MCAFKLHADSIITIKGSPSTTPHLFILQYISIYIFNIINPTFFLPPPLNNMYLRKFTWDNQYATDRTVQKFTISTDLTASYCYLCYSLFHFRDVDLRSKWMAPLFLFLVYFIFSAHTQATDSPRSFMLLSIKLKNYPL